MSKYYVVCLEGIFCISIIIWLIWEHKETNDSLKTSDSVITDGEIRACHPIFNFKGKNKF